MKYSSLEVIIKSEDIKKVDFIHGSWDDVTVCALCGNKSSCECYHFKCPCGENEDVCRSPDYNCPCRVCEKIWVECLCDKPSDVDSGAWYIMRSIEFRRKNKTVFNEEAIELYTKLSKLTNDKFRK